MSTNLLKHADCLNTELKSPKTRRYLTQVPRPQIAEVLFTAKLTNLFLALSHILTIVSTGQKSSELLFTLTLEPYYWKAKTLFQKRNTEPQ